MEFKKLFKRNVNGSIIQWEIFVDENTYWTRYGQVNGKIIESEKIIVNGKNIGKKNETTPEEQAIKEAKSIWSKKIKSENFSDSIFNVDVKTFNPPMLAQVYSGIYSDDLKFCQPKLDGIRCNINFNGEVIALSRKNNYFNTVDHIKESLSEVLSIYPSLHLDGELYNHNLHDDFNEIISLVNKKNIDDEDKCKIKQNIRYNVYDMWDDNNPNLTFKERNKIINDLLRNVEFVDIVETKEINSSDDIEKYFEYFTENGYEGLIIRKDNPYEHKRSKNLLKYKKFKEDEFKIIDICEGKVSGKAEYAWVKLNNGKKCKATLAFSDEICKNMLNDKENLIGKMATVKYFGYTAAGKLRFPEFKCVRNYE